MPDHRKHRGPHPRDRELFASEHHSRLLTATTEMSWLLTRGYAQPSSLKLVGDRHALDARQRTAVARSACSDQSRTRRLQHEVDVAAVVDQTLWIDGYNLITLLEAALSLGVILMGRDSCCRDLASMHGNYRKVAETEAALSMVGEVLSESGASGCRWFLDQPVSNSGRLKQLLVETAAKRGWDWQVDLVPDPDPVLIEAQTIVVSADSQILDRADRWFNLGRRAIVARIPTAWIVDLSAPKEESPA